MCLAVLVVLAASTAGVSAATGPVSLATSTRSGPPPVSPPVSRTVPADMTTSSTTTTAATTIPGPTTTIPATTVPSTTSTDVPVVTSTTIGCITTGICDPNGNPIQVTPNRPPPVPTLPTTSMIVQYSCGVADIQPYLFSTPLAGTTPTEYRVTIAGDAENSWPVAVTGVHATFVVTFADGSTYGGDSGPVNGNGTIGAKSAASWQQWLPPSTTKAVSATSHDNFVPPPASTPCN